MGAHEYLEKLCHNVNVWCLAALPMAEGAHVADTVRGICKRSCSLPLLDVRVRGSATVLLWNNQNFGALR
jgi:hypothetical protein